MALAGIEVLRKGTQGFEHCRLAVAKRYPASQGRADADSRERRLLVEIRPGEPFRRSASAGFIRSIHKDAARSTQLMEGARSTTDRPKGSPDG